MAKALQRDLCGYRVVGPVEQYIDATIVTNGISRAFSTGALCHPFKTLERISGVVVNVGKTNPLQTMVDMRKTRLQVQYTGKVRDARYPHTSHWGRVFFISTPDGENCGLVKNLATTALISTNILEPILPEFFSCGMEELVDDTSTSLDGKNKVFLNGDWVGVCEDSGDFVTRLRTLRRRKKLLHQMEIKRDEQLWEVQIYSDAGRILRPFLLIGAEEEEDCCTAWDVRHLFMEDNGKSAVKYTHCELDLSFLLGLSCGIIPFSNHDHARRVLYQSQKHSQQVIGFSTTNPNHRVVTLSHQLRYPQRPLFCNMISDCLGQPGNPAEAENKFSLGKRRNPDDCINFGKIQSRFGSVDSLDDDGFPRIGAYLLSGDIIIGRCSESGTDHSIKLRHTERGNVQKVVLSSNDEGKNFGVVSLRQMDWFVLLVLETSSQACMGVLGFLESEENFPFTIQGIVPDIVINPHAFPSRQAPGQLLEAALGKGIACGGSMRYATPFSTPSVDDITDQLHGNIGPVHPLTRQPVADRKRFCGVKFGEMELDCLIAHGASANLHERLFTLCDSSQMHACQKCKNAANVIDGTVDGRRIRGPYCPVCKSVDDIVRMNVPYGAKLLCQELFSMGISLKFETRLR
ncbi:hypothetical protein ABKV19_004659 [Rosa sericea]